jgi:hypothetical protein
MPQNGHGSQPDNRGSNGSTLATRVRDRVAAAQRDQERRDGATRPRVGAKKKRIDLASTNPDLTPEVLALRSVFKDFGKLHQQYRERTGEGTSPELRAAATAFKKDPNFGALVVVAGFLEELELLQ